jgi:glutathione S-transferase
MKLYGSYTSPFVRHCRIVLLEAGLPFEFVETDFIGSATKSPTKRVPFLEDGKQFFTDSSSIIRYLREKAGETFCASAKELDDFCLVNTALDATTNLFFIERDGVQVTEIPYLQRQAARIESILGELNAMDLPMCSPYNDAQLRLACFMGWAKFRKRVDFTSFSTLEKFFANANSYENFSATAPD